MQPCNHALLIPLNLHLAILKMRIAGSICFRLKKIQFCDILPSYNLLLKRRKEVIFEGLVQTPGKGGGRKLIT
jgi:hypothetical protein